MKYTLLEKQQEFFNIPHNNSLDVVIYQGGYGSGKTWCGSLLGLMLARKYATKSNNTIQISIQLLIKPEKAAVAAVAKIVKIRSINKLIIPRYFK